MWPVAASHTVIVPFSPPPEAMRVPSGLNATPVTPTEYPGSVRVPWPLAASHSLTVPSPGLVEAMRVLSGLNATSKT